MRPPYDVYFGDAVGGFGNDKVLIGAPFSYENTDTWDVFGAAYLYSTIGKLLATFTNFNPGVFYGLGFSVAAFGTERVLVGAPGHGTNIGAVHLFNTSGTLLLTITNPAPAEWDHFGARIAMVGNNRAVIAAPLDNTTGSGSGSAYVFSVDGTLLATINNPEPGGGDSFGSRLAAFGNEGVFIGAPWAGGVGSAYLFSIPATPGPHSLTIQRTTTNTVVVSWPSTSTGFVLQQNTNGIPTVNWSNVTSNIQDNGTNKTLIVNPTSGNRFYRLVSP